MPRKVSGRRAPAPAPKKPKRAYYSPAGTGPAGSRLEGQIGAQYLLALLGVGAPRGLPQVATVTRVEFQRAASGHPMDDVIVRGLLPSGRPVTLELQAKRTVTFAAKDEVFADVVRRAVQVFRKPEFATEEYIVAVAVGRTSTKIDQHVQTALRWARDLQEPAAFFTHLQRPGFGDKEAWEFVANFRRHMDAELGAPASDEDVWGLMRRFLVLPFDFGTPGSQAEQVAHERCALALATAHANRAAELWDTLVEHALALDSTGGDATPESLKGFLGREHDYQLAGDRRWRPARLALGHASQDALRDIRRTVLGLRLPRDQVLGTVRAALQDARYVEIHGAGGVGKSAVLATLAEEVMAESHVIVLAPARVPAGGWWALQDQLGVDATAREFLTDLAGDGGAVLFIDGVDRIDDPDKQATVRDLLRAAADVPGFQVVATARDEFSDADLRAWLPQEALTTLQCSPIVRVGELTDTEAQALAAANEALASLLHPGHPAQQLVRNLFRLERLERIVSSSAAGTPVSEAQMARQWWDSADGADTPSRRLMRQQLLHDLAVQALSMGGPMDPRAWDERAVTGLLDRQTLLVTRPGHVELAHDVLRDWAIGCLMVDEPGRLQQLPIARPAPALLMRGVEMAARLLAEGLVHGPSAAGDASAVEAFSALLANVSGPNAHGSWRRAVLLALVRSECAEQALTRFAGMLASADAQLFEELVRCVMVVDSRQANEGKLLSGADVPPDMVALPVPKGPSWRHLIEWTLNNPQSVPDAAVPVVTELYHRWNLACVGHILDAEAEAAQLLPAIVARLHEWLARVEGSGEPQHYPSAQAWAEAQARPRLALIGPDARALEKVCLFWAKADPVRTDAYVRKITKQRERDDFCRRLIDRQDAVAWAAPAALADLFIAVLCRHSQSPVSVEGPFDAWDTVYEPGSPGRRPFLELLQAAPSEGLRLVRTLVSHAAARVAGEGRSDEGLTVQFEAGARRFALPRSYLWPRGQRGAVLSSALMALEAWGHERIERGDAIGAVINDVLGPDGSCAAYVAVAVDLVLSHLPRSLPDAAVFASSAQLLVLDHARTALDLLLQQQEERSQRFGSPLARPELPGLPTRASLQRRPSRKFGLNAMHSPIAMKGPAAIRDAMVKALEAEAQRLGPPPGADEPVSANTVLDPRVAAAIALHRLDPSHYDTSTAAEGGVVYRPSEFELRLDAAERTQSWPGALSVQLLLQHAVCDGRVDLAALRTALEWVDRALGELAADGEATPLDPHDQRDARRLATIAAMLVLRDGDEPLQGERSGWAHSKLLAAIARARPGTMGLTQSLPFNEASIAGMGLLASLRLRPSAALAHQLLRLAARRDAGMPAVLALEVAAGRAVDRRLGVSFIRLGLASAVLEMRSVADGAMDSADPSDARAFRVWLEEADRRRGEREDARLERAVQAETDWLEGKGAEPWWPTFPAPGLRAHGLRPQAAQPTSNDAAGAAASPAAPQFVVDTLLAGQWLDIAQAMLLPLAPEAAGSLLDHYWPWTAEANGVGVSDGDLVDTSPQLRLGWNSTYFTLLVRHRTTCEPQALSDCLQRAGELPVDAFFDAAAIILQGVDRQWLNDSVIDEGSIRSLRMAMIERMVSTHEWHHLTREVSNRASMSMGELIAALFFGEYEVGKGPRCCLLPSAMPQVEPFLPLLAEFAERGARSVVVAAAFLGLMDVQPQWRHLHLVARVHSAWRAAHGSDRRFWHGFGAAERLCHWIASAMQDKGDATATAPRSASPTSSDSALVSMLDELVRVGSLAAQQLERQLGIDRSVG